jgi:hypothetical protein
MEYLAPQFDPENPAHRTIAQWQALGPGPWRLTAIDYALVFGESRVLLPEGAVYRWYLGDDGLLREEVL